MKTRMKGVLASIFFFPAVIVHGFISFSFKPAPSLLFSFSSRPFRSSLALQQRPLRRFPTRTLVSTQALHLFSTNHPKTRTTTKLSDKKNANNHVESNNNENSPNPPEDLSELLKYLGKNLSGNMVVIENKDGSGSGGSGDPPNTANSNSRSSNKDNLQTLRTFDLKPKEVVEYLDRFVIQQQDAKKVLAVAICDHYNHCRRCLQEQELSSVKNKQNCNTDDNVEKLFVTEEDESKSEYAKPNVLLAGPTGVGKTYLLKCLARLVGVPFVKADATKFSETGIVGRDAEDLVRDLVDAADGNVALAGMGIIYVDEIDKIANGGGEDVTTTRGSFNTRGVQNNFLKLLEETDVSLDRQGEMTFRLPPGLGGEDGEEEKGRSINTRNILFIFSGAFTNLDKDIRRKREKKPFGIEIDSSGGGGHDSFGDTYNGSDVTNKKNNNSNRLFPEQNDINRPAGKGQSYLKYAETADFVRAGLEPEFVGRVPVRVALDGLDANDLKQILTGAEGSVLNQFLRDFEGYGIKMDISNSDDALTAIAIQAEEEGTGARGLVTVLERTLREHKFELPSSSIHKFNLDVETVSDPPRALRRLLSTETASDGAAVRLDDLKRWEQKIVNDLPSTVRVWLTEEAQNYFIIQSLETDVSAYSFVTKRFGSMLTNVVRRINELTGQTAFPISIEVARNPEVELRKWLSMLKDIGTTSNVAGADN